MPALLPTADWSALAARTMQRCDDLARDSEEADRITRRFCTAALAAAHRRLKRWFEASGLHCRIDNLANFIGSTANPDPSRDPTESSKKVPRQRKRLLIGSHLDTVPGAGRYDGSLGVLIGLAVVEALQNVSLTFDVEIICFSEKEGTRFHTPYLGSRGIAGTFDESLLERTDEDDLTMRTALHLFDCDPDQVASAAYDPKTLIGFIEPHIEQGPLLKDDDVPLGLVASFAGHTRMNCRFHGKPPQSCPSIGSMDAGLAASQFNVALREYTKSMPNLQAAVGAMQFQSGFPHGVPNVAEFEIEIRHADDEARNAATVWARANAETIAKETDCEFEVLSREDEATVPNDPLLREALAHTIQEAGYPVRKMVSGTSHDSIVMAELTPTATLFVRNLAGISHHPDELVNDSDVSVAIEILTRLICELDGR